MSKKAVKPKIHLKGFRVSWSLPWSVCGFKTDLERHLVNTTRNRKDVTCEKCKKIGRIK